MKEDIFVSKPSMPGQFDAVYAEVELRDGYRAIASDSDPYTRITVLKDETPLFSALVADHKTAIPTIEENIEAYIAEVEKADK